MKAHLTILEGDITNIVPSFTVSKKKKKSLYMTAEANSI